MGSRGKVYVPDGSSQPSFTVHGDALATSIFTRITTFYATESERNTETVVPTKMSAAQKLGMRCWVDERKGFCFWDGSAWRWEPQRNVLMDGRRSAAAESSGSALVPIILMSNTALPPGDRRLQIIASCNMVALATGNSLPRAVVSGPGIAASEGAVAGVSLFAGFPFSAARTWTVVTSGTVSYNMYGQDAHPTAPVAVRFTDSILQVFDLGPA